MSSSLLSGTGSFFDLLEERWQKLTTQRRVASALVIVFLAGLALVEARRIPWLSPELTDRLPSNHFEAILLPFTLLLLAEVISLVFAIVQSVAIAVGKQLEIMSLILIRQSFKELTYFPEPIVWDLTSGEITRRVLYILSDASGALIIFALLVIYFRMQTHQPISRDPDDQSSFVGAKKLIALALLASLAVIAADVVRGRRIACPPDIAMDVTNAGGRYVEDRAVRDGGLFTSVYFAYLPEQFRQLIPALAEG